MKEQAKRRLKDWSAHNEGISRISGYLADSLDDDLASAIMQPSKTAAQMWDYIIARMQKLLLPKTPTSGAYGFPVAQDEVFKTAIEYLHATDDEVKSATAVLKGTAHGKGATATNATSKLDNNSTRPKIAPKPGTKHVTKPVAKPAAEQTSKPKRESTTMNEKPPKTNSQPTLMDLLGG